MAMRCKKCNRQYDITTGFPEGEICCGEKLELVNIKGEAPAGYVHWGNPIRRDGSRKGYHPEKDDPVTEMKADLESLKEKQMHTTDPKTDMKLKKSLKHFEYQYEGLRNK